MAIFRRNRKQDELPYAADAEQQAAAPEGTGPFDRSQVASLEGMVDLGAIALPAVQGMELRLELDEATQAITGVTVVMGESVGQFQAFAAPRTMGIWSEVREEIWAALRKTGGSAEEVEGEWGDELHAKLPGRGADGSTTYQPARFIGVNGPRWFARLVLTGRAAAEEKLAEPLLDLLRGAVITRGTDAMAPRELLPLRLPEQDEQPVGPGATGPIGAGQHADDLRPFERGPEITEIR